MQGLTVCPIGGCGFAVSVRRGKDRRVKCDCQKCGYSFCTKCGKLYHYHSDCEDLITIQRIWLEWCRSGRERYITQVAQEDESYTQALDEYKRESAKHQAEVQVAERNWETLQGDEYFKQTSCRHCPSCQRVIQRITGCDSMVCGSDAHGGNVQSGCGANFNWMGAAPYKADVGRRSSIPDFSTLEPEETER